MDIECNKRKIIERKKQTKKERKKGRRTKVCLKK